MVDMGGGLGSIAQCLIQIAFYTFKCKYIMISYTNVFFSSLSLMIFPLKLFFLVQNNCNIKTK